MKYENLNSVLKITNQISNLYENLKFIEDSAYVGFALNSGYAMNIGVKPEICEEKNTILVILARDFKTDCIEKIKNEIQSLKDELLLL